MESTGILIVCIALTLISVVLMTSSVCVWVYRDAKERGERAWMWVAVILMSSPILGGLLYLIARREEKLPCRFCGWKVNRDARYCERCGREYPLPENTERKTDAKIGSRTKKMLAVFSIGLVMMICSVVFLVVSAVGSDDIDWNTGWVMMNVESTRDNVWSFRYNKASENYHTSSKLKVENPDRQRLAIRLRFEQEEEMKVVIEQDGTEQESFVQSGTQTSYLPLNEFEPGKVKVTFYNNGVSDVRAEVTVE